MVRLLVGVVAIGQCSKNLVPQPEATNSTHHEGLDSAEELKDVVSVYSFEQ